MAFEEKAKLKEKITIKLVQNLKACKVHVESLMEKDEDKYISLDHDEVMNEISYLKKTHRNCDSRKR